MPSMNTRLEVAKSVGMPLVELERTMEESIAATAAIMSAVMAGRAKARLPLHAGQEGLENLASITSLLVAVRKKLHEAHYVFRDVQEQMGLGTVSYGDHGDTPDAEFVKTRSSAPALQVVSAA